MRDLIGWMLQWTFSTAGLMHVVGAGLLAAAAIRFSPHRATGKFALVALLLWLIASALGVPATPNARAVVSWLIWTFTITAFYAVVLGILVANQKGPRAILAATAAALVVQIPLSWFSGLYLTCYVGHDCP